MKEKSRSTEIKIVVDAKDNNIDCVATVNVGSIDLDTTIELLQICIDELTKKKMEGEFSSFFLFLNKKRWTSHLSIFQRFRMVIHYHLSLQEVGFHHIQCVHLFLSEWILIKLHLMLNN